MYRRSALFGILTFAAVWWLEMIVTDAKTFGEVIRKRRKSLHYTQKYLAEFTGFSASYISDLENGKASIELGKAIYLANILGLDCMLSVRGEAKV